MPVDFVADAVATLHQKEKPEHEIYHLSSGRGSETFSQLTDALSKAQGKRGPVFVPGLEGPSSKMVSALAGRAGKIGGLAHSAESLSALSRVEYGLRQFARGRRNGAPTRAIFRVLLSVVTIQSREQFSLQVPRMARGRLRSHSSAKSRRRAGFAPMTDLALEAWVSGLIELNKFEWMLGAGEAWKPGAKLKLLFAGYNGTRNTGSDVRVEEMLRQVRRILGAENIALSVMSQNFDLTRGYFGDAKQVYLPDVFPPFLHSEVRKNDGVVACEGSMFKSKFANALTTMMIGALGIAAAQNKVSVAYGAEAGEMDPLLRKMCRRYCHNSLVITRNVESQGVLGKLGVPTELGTDTAWTFEPHPPEYGRNALRDAGWDGRTPVLAVCPINPFWWPVKASIAKWIAHSAAGAYKKSYYRTIYFHRSGQTVDAAYDKYLRRLRRAWPATKNRAQCFPFSSRWNCWTVMRANASRKNWTACPSWHRTIQHVSAGEHSACVPHGFVALSRHCDIHAGAGAVGGHHHG